MVAWVPLIAAGASALSSIFGANKQASAVKDAASDQARAQADALKVQQENSARNYALLSPIANNLSRFAALGQVGAGGQSVRQQYLPSSFNAIGKTGAAAQQEADLDAYIEQNPWLEGYWNSWEAGGAAKGKYTHRQQFGDFRGYAQDSYLKSRPPAAPAAPQGASYLAKPRPADGEIRQMKDGATARFDGAKGIFVRVS